MRKRYTMNEANSVAKRASRDIEEYLKSFPYTINVINVEDDPIYREKDIDLLWNWYNNGKKVTTKIEVKGDRYYRTGNYFFETVSNKSKGTPGCFMYTEANFVFYYFVDEKELHILPMPETRDWFIENMDKFVERETSTPVGNTVYITVGRLVNRDLLQENVKWVRVISLK
ncbi:hypothetical protein [Aeribacillus pallidus]|uniref:hypothetical protein n=1 Tax=Aeribacillus pallidus TaxID=33936 RepID=UPI003D202140